jgi:hypothetical protein
MFELVVSMGGKLMKAKKPYKSSTYSTEGVRKNIVLFWEAWAFH